MRGQRIQQRKRALGVPWALLMVVLLAVVHPASRWICYFAMPWEAVSHGMAPISASQPHHGAHSHAHAHGDAAARKATHENPAHAPAPGKSHDGACCLDVSSHNYLSGKAPHISQPIFERDFFSPDFTLDVAHFARFDAPGLIIHPPRDGTLFSLPSPFLSSSPGRAPPVMA